jgi:hypothetical protein
MTRQKFLSNCNCRDEGVIFAADDDGLETELNLTCPVHAERRLGRLLNFDIVADGVRVPRLGGTHWWRNMNDVTLQLE